MLGYGFYEQYHSIEVHIHLPINSVCLIFQFEVESGEEKVWKQEAEDANWQVLSDHIHLPLLVSSDHKMVKRQIITCQTAPTFLTWYCRKLLLYLCENTCVAFVWVNSATYVTCKEMKQECQKTFLMDYWVITTYFATGPSYFAICCYFLWKKNKQNF